MHSRKVLAEILERSNLSAPDSFQPLWRYPVTALDLAALKREFSDHAAVPRRLDRVQEGALALLAAHLLCEHLRAGAWKWDPVFDELGWERNDLEVQRLREHLGDGLELYWRRKVRRVAGNRECLGTLLLEGGLPIAWFKGEGDGGVQVFLQRLIRLVERYAVPATELADEQLELLPETAREPSTVRQLATMADVIVQLRRRLPRGCESPADFLSVTDPDWRSRLPLAQVRKEHADDIVARLLATESGVENGPPFLDLNWILIRDTGRIERTLTLPHRIVADALKSELGGSEADLPSVMYVILESSAGRRLPLARLEGRGDGSSYTVVPAGAPSRIGGVDEWRAVITAQGQELGSFMPVGGDALDTALPWVFDDRPAGNRGLLSAGSCDSRHQQFLVSMPSEAEPPVAIDGASSVERINDLGDEHRAYYRVIGSARASIGDELFQFVGGGDVTTGNLRLRALGPRVWLGTPGTTPFLGPPRISAHDGDRPVAVPQDQLQWRAADGSGRWRDWSRESPAGEVSVRWRHDGCTLARVRLTAVPAAFRIATTRSGSSATVELNCRGLRGVYPDDGFPAATETVDEGVYRIRATEERPQASEMPTRLTFSCGTVANVRLPIPSPFTGFVGPRGRWLPNGAILSFASTDSLRARGAGHAEFLLDARIPGESKWELVASTKTSPSGWAEISLDAVRAQLEPLLSSTDLDRTVELLFHPTSRMDPQYCKLRLANYGLEVRYDEEQDADGNLCGYKLHVVSSSGHALDVEELRVLSLQLLRLTVPWEKWIDIERHDDNRFWLGIRDLAPGPYLVLVFEGGLLRSRPELLVAPGEADTQGSSIGRTATIPEFNARQEAWRSLFEDMTCSFEHSAWIDLHNLLGVTDRVPASSFELMGTLAKLPDATCAAILRQPSLDHVKALSRALGQLGVMLECIPMRAWLRAVKRLTAFVENFDGLVSADRSPEAALAMVAKGCFGGSASPLPVLELLRSIGRMVGLRLPIPTVNHLSYSSEMLRAAMGGLWERVLRRHAENYNWPQATFNKEALDAATEIELPECLEFQGDVLRAPVVAAAASFYSIPLAEPQVRRLRQVRLFDPEWFETAHVIALALLTKEHFDVVQGHLDDI